MKPALNIQMGQQLRLTPQLLQSIRLLQLPALALEQEVREALERNVMLELEEPADGAPDPAQDAQEVQEVQEAPVAAAPETAPDWEAAAVQSAVASAPSEDDEGFEARNAAPDTRDVRQKVLDQLELTLTGPRELRIAEVLVDHINDAGYLEQPWIEIEAAVKAVVPATSGQILAVLHHLQRLDPPGYGAANLRDCLLIQLELLGPNTPGRTLAMRVVDEHLEALAAGDFEVLAQALGSTQDALQRASRLIRSLSPKPGAAGADDAAAYAVPDVIVRRVGSGWQVELNPATVPRVRINGYYEQLLNHCPSEGHARRLRDQLQEARWLVRGLEMRNDTLLRTACVLVERQRVFLERGEEGMKPLTLREVADAIGMHESTVSRITTQKYIQTPRGLFELKHFFASSLGDGDRGGASGTAVRAMVRRMIEAESPARPLADGVIAQLLERQGVRVARRTVSKYREALRIPAARERLREGAGRE